MLAVGAIAASGCGGSTKTFANKAPPAAPVNLTVYINNARVSVSPGTTGAGPVTFVVTNHATTAQSIKIEQSGGGQTVANTGPINPQGTAAVNVDFRQQGQYTIAVGGTEASSAASSIAPATITIGPPRPSARGDLLVP
jgi:hypothetical protein